MSEVDGLTLQLFCFSSPPSYICGVAPCLTLSLSLTDYVSLSLKAHYSVSPSLPPSLFTTHTHLLSPFSVFQQIVFSSLLLELQLDAFLFPSPSL